MSQRKLAAHLGVSTRSIQNYESGASIPYRHAYVLERLFGKRHGWLLDGYEAAAVSGLVTELMDLRAALSESRARCRVLRAESRAARALHQEIVERLSEASRLHRERTTKNGR